MITSNRRIFYFSNDDYCRYYVVYIYWYMVKLIFEYFLMVGIWFLFNANFNFLDYKEKVNKYGN